MSVQDLTKAAKKAGRVLLTINAESRAPSVPLFNKVEGLPFNLDSLNRHY